MTQQYNPLILYENKNSVNDLEKLKKNYKIWKTYDIYDRQEKELFEILFPSITTSPTSKSAFIKFKTKRKKRSNVLQGNWIYFPWNGNLIHTVNEKEYYTLRTNRNKNLITADEQKMLNDACVGIVGLSVGSSIAIGLAYQGIAQTMKLAEFDTLETTNLNRVRATISHIGTPKIHIAAQQIYEINPYSKLHLFSEGLTKNVLKQFLTKNPKPRIIFEIIDDFEIKIHLRFMARSLRIPVVMLANLGDSVLIDIERYDLDKTLPLFHGVLGKLPEEILDNPNEDKNKYAVAIVGKENVPKRALESVREIGKTLVGRPQLASTITIGSGLASYLVRHLLLDKPLQAKDI